MANRCQPLLQIGHSGGRPVAQRVAKRISKNLLESGNTDHPIWVIGYNGAFDRQRPPDGVEGIRVVSDDDALDLLRLWKKGDITIPGGHGPDLGEGVSTVFNVLLYLIHFDAQNPGVIGAAVGGGSETSSRDIVEYMKRNINSMNPGDQASLIEVIEADLNSRATDQ